MLSYGLVISEVDENGRITTEGYEDEISDVDFSFIGQHYGFSSSPAIDETLILGEVGEEVVVVGGDPHNRPDLESGQVILWDNAGNSVKLYNDKDGTSDIKITAGSGATITVGHNGEITINATSGSKVYCVGKVICGETTASEAMVLGSTLYTDLDNFYDAMQAATGTWITDVGAATNITQLKNAHNTFGAAWQSAMSTLITAMRGWLSLKHKLD